MKKCFVLTFFLLLFSGCQNTSEKVHVDLNGDGAEDEIELSLISNAYVLSVNDSRIVLEGDNLEGNFRVVDINTADSFKEIAVLDFGPSDDYMTNFFYYDGKDIYPMRTIEGRLNDDLILDGQGSIVTQVRGKILDTWFHEESYVLDENRNLYIPETLYVALYERNTPVVLLHDFTPQKSPEDASAAFTLQKGDSATIDSCDDIKWCSIQNGEGQTGWFAIEGFNQIVGTDFYSGDLFEGLSFAD